METTGLKSERQIKPLEARNDLHQETQPPLVHQQQALHFPRDDFAERIKTMYFSSWKSRGHPYYSIALI